MGRESEWPRHNETQADVDIENIARKVADLEKRIEELEQTQVERESVEAGETD